MRDKKLEERNYAAEEISQQLQHQLQQQQQQQRQRPIRVARGVTEDLERCRGIRHIVLIQRMAKQFLRRRRMRVIQMGLQYDAAVVIQMQVRKQVPIAAYQYLTQPWPWRFIVDTTVLSFLSLPSPCMVLNVLVCSACIQ